MVWLGSRLGAYLASIAFTAAAALARLALDASMSIGLPFLTFFLAVMLSSWFGGVGPGLLATALSTAAAYWLVPPDRLAIGGASALAVLARFFAVAALVSWLIDRWRRAQALASERLEMQLRLRDELLDRERRALAEAVAARDRLAFLAEVSAVLTSSLDYQETLDRAVHLALPRLGDYCTVLVEDDLARLRHVASGHVNPDKEAAMRDLVRKLVESPDPPSVPTYSHDIMRTGKPVIVSHFALAAAVTQATTAMTDEELLRFGNQVRPYAYLGVPLLVRGRAIGVMSFGTGQEESAREYDENDVASIEEFARRVALAIENARLFRQADELNRLKDEFLATLSHELRTPLTAVLGWARMLVNDQLEPEKAEHALRAIERNAQAQTQIVDDILDVARGMTGNLRLSIEHVDVLTVTRHAIEAIAPAAAAKQIDVVVHGSSPMTIVGDAGRMQQVVWNLLSNAVKFTPAGGRITIDIAAHDRQVELQVTDTGVGIPQTFLPYVFEKFRQADGSFTRQYGGLGLGLAIARHLVELHGGSIEARSEGEGRGATFVIRLPAAVAQGTP